MKSEEIKKIMEIIKTVFDREVGASETYYDEYENYSIVTGEDEFYKSVENELKKL